MGGSFALLSVDVVGGAVTMKVGGVGILSTNLTIKAKPRTIIVHSEKSVTNSRVEIKLMILGLWRTPRKLV